MSDWLDEGRRIVKGEPSRALFTCVFRALMEQASMFGRRVFYSAARFAGVESVTEHLAPIDQAQISFCSLLSSIPLAGDRDDFIL